MTFNLTPYRWIEEERQVAVLWALVSITLLLMLALSRLEPPGGWIRLEFPALNDSTGPGSPRSWSQAQREKALFGLGVDFLFLLVYPLFLSLFLERAGTLWKLAPGLARQCLALSSVILLAAPLDALENLGLYWLIRDEAGIALRWFITAVAALKWLLVLFAVAAVARCLWARRPKKEPIK